MRGGKGETGETGLTVSLPLLVVYELGKLKDSTYFYSMGWLVLYDIEVATNCHCILRPPLLFFRVLKDLLDFKARVAILETL